jgi:hypothetical protein
MNAITLEEIWCQYLLRDITTTRLKKFKQKSVDVLECKSQSPGAKHRDGKRDRMMQ